VYYNEMVFMIFHYVN